MGTLGYTGPGSGDLFQAVGVKPKMMIDLVVDKPQVGDIYMLCSDGLSKMAKDDQIRQIIAEEGKLDLESAVYGLIELANDRGGKDNVTVILVRVEQPDSLSLRHL
jgi:protein phosphatase